CIAAMATTAKASLISNRSTSATLQPADFSTLFTAATGAIVNHSGASALLAQATSRATGLSPLSFAVAALESTSAAAPSEIEEDEAAVTVPLAAKAGLSCGILEMSQVPGVSSRATTVTPLRPLTSIGATSASTSPASSARSARRTDSAAKASCAARVKAYF